MKTKEKLIAIKALLYQNMDKHTADDAMQLIEEYSKESITPMSEEEIDKWIEDAEFTEYNMIFKEDLPSWLIDFQSHFLSRVEDKPVTLGKNSHLFNPHQFEDKGKLLTDDCDLNKNKLEVFVGGNGDYYISVIDDISHYVRISMSGGNASTKVKLAVANLYRAMNDVDTGEKEDVKQDIRNMNEMDFLYWLWKRGLMQTIPITELNNLADEYKQDKPAEETPDAQTEFERTNACYGNHIGD